MSAIEVYEVYKVIRRDLSEERAVEGVSALRRAEDDRIRHGEPELRLPPPAPASRRPARSGADFEGLPGAVVIR